MKYDDNIKNQYTTLWNTMVIKDSVKPIINSIINKIVANKDKYVQVQNLTKSKVPWYIISIIHTLECNGDFTRYLYNGDKIANGKTTNVPAGRPVDGIPMTWIDTAADSLNDRPWYDWSNEGSCFFFENYNGWGYKLYHNIPSPYLFSGTSVYLKGKYTTDGKFDPNAVSQQIGAAAILKQMQLMNLIENIIIPSNNPSVDSTVSVNNTSTLASNSDSTGANLIDMLKMLEKINKGFSA